MTYAICWTSSDRVAMSTYSTEMVDIPCPYCGETIDVVVDLSVEYQEYIEDCSVCCRPIVMTATVIEGAPRVVVRHENE